MLFRSATGTSSLDGSPRLRARPMRDGVQLLAGLGAHVTRAGEGELPLWITPSDAVRRGGCVSIERPASSQFLSALALVAPWMQSGLRIEVRGGLPSDSYVELTVQCLRALGVAATWDASAGVLVVHPSPLRGFQVRVEQIGRAHV